MSKSIDCNRSIHHFVYMGLQSASNSLRNFKLGLFTSDSVIGGNLRQGLLWFYDLEQLSGTRFDSSLNSLDLSEVGTVTLDPAGVIGGSAKFNGISGNDLGHANDPLYDFSDSDFTFTGWFQLTNKSANMQFQYIGIGGAVGAENIIFIRFNNIEDEVRAGVSDGSGTPVTQDIGGTIPLNEFIFYTLIWNKTTREIRLSLNDGPFSSNTMAGPIQNLGTQVYRLGAMQNTAETLLGELDEIGGWNRILTPEEITFLYNDGNGNRPNFASALRDELGNVLEDDSGNVLAGL